MNNGKPPNVGKTPLFEDCDIEVRDRLPHSNRDNLGIGPSYLIEMNYLLTISSHTNRAFKD